MNFSGRYLAVNPLLTRSFLVNPALRHTQRFLRSPTVELADGPRLFSECISTFCARATRHVEGSLSVSRRPRGGSSLYQLLISYTRTHLTLILTACWMKNSANGQPRPRRTLQGRWHARKSRPKLAPRWRVATLLTRNHTHRSTPSTDAL